MKSFLRTLDTFYEDSGRHNLPWREGFDTNEVNPYSILVSEIMLQQTQVERVIPKYRAWLRAFPTTAALAQSSRRDVQLLWSGLGYNRRGVNLQRAAEMIERDMGGELPTNRLLLQTLPGVGPYTSGAICAFAFNMPEVFIETNIRTVFLHHFFKDSTDIADSEILPLIEESLATREPRHHYAALMDYGAHLKRVVGNASRRSKHHTKQSKFEGSNRQKRSAILRHLLHNRAQRVVEISVELGIAKDVVKANVDAMEREGLLSNDNGVYSV